MLAFFKAVPPPLSGCKSTTDRQVCSRASARASFPISHAYLWLRSHFTFSKEEIHFATATHITKTREAIEWARSVMSTRTATTLNTASTVISSKQSKPLVTTTPPAKIESRTKVECRCHQGQDVTVQLQYLKDDPIYRTTKPIQITPNFPLDSRTNVQVESGPLETINDVRGRAEEFTLDANGFRYLHAPTKYKDWSSQPQIAKEYLPELEGLLKREIDGCDEVIFYDARIRQESDQGARVQGLSYNPFARQVHVDNTETSCIEKIRNITEMKADYYLGGRARIINIWRPIKHPVYDCGLAIADGGKLHNDDVIECDRRRQDTGDYWDTMGVVKYRKGYDWYYMSLQDEVDVLLFKNYDSATDVGARHCLHTAFDLPLEEVPADAPTRESIEVRALVFTHPKGTRRPSGGARPHPLAVHLEQNNLKLVDEEHSITDRLRTDIDEGNEVKDAVLLLRRQEIRRLEGVRESLLTERTQLQHGLDQSHSELEQAQQQINIQKAHVEALQSKVHGLQQQLSHSHEDLHKQVYTFSKELADARMYEQTRARTELDGLIYASHAVGLRGTHNPETALLLERIENQQLEIEKWKAEAMGRGNEAVSRCWQTSVDEAVRRERENDSFVIQALRGEIEKLKAGHDDSELGRRA